MFLVLDAVNCSSRASSANPTMDLLEDLPPFAGGMEPLSMPDPLQLPVLERDGSSSDLAGLITDDNANTSSENVSPRLLAPASSAGRAKKSKKRTDAEDEEFELPDDDGDDMQGGQRPSPRGERAGAPKKKKGKVRCTVL
jgi:hypothetical protein